MIGIIDYGMGNINAFKNIYYENNIDVKIINNVENFDSDIKKIILPGVGSYDYAIQSLQSLGFLEKIDEFLKTPSNHFLGICLGMQILCQFSQEGLEKGIGVFDQKIKKFENISTPHMGWNNIKIIKKDPLLKDVPNNSEFYFLHSYFLETKNDENTLCLSKYSKNFFFFF